MIQNNSSDKIQKLVEKTYGARYRLRICGVICQNDKILMVKNVGVGKNGFLWAPPGGEVKFGEFLTDCLEREVHEETGVLAKTGEFLFVHEYISHPFHAVELHFEMKPTSIKISLGSDPELSGLHSGIADARWLDFEKINQISIDNKHGIFKKVDSLKDLLDLRGLVKSQ